MKSYISKGLSIIIATVLVIGSLVACSSTETTAAKLPDATVNKSEKVRIVTTIFPE